MAVTSRASRGNALSGKQWWNVEQMAVSCTRAGSDREKRRLEVERSLGSGLLLSGVFESFRPLAQRK